MTLAVAVAAAEAAAVAAAEAATEAATEAVSETVTNIAEYSSWRRRRTQHIWQRTQRGAGGVLQCHVNKLCSGFSADTHTT